MYKYIICLQSYLIKIGYKISFYDNGFNKSYDYSLIIYHVITTDHNISYDYNG